MAPRNQRPYDTERAIVLDRLAYLEPVDSEGKRIFRKWYVLNHLEDWDWDKIDHYNNLLRRYLHGEHRYQGVLIRYNPSDEKVA